MAEPDSKPAHHEHHTANHAPPQQGVVFVQPSATVIAMATALPPMVSPNPMALVCPNCHQSVMTTITYENGTLTWILTFGLCFIGCWLCCFIPLCSPGVQDVIHTCPNCNFFLGRYCRC